jgi:cytochrome c-type biogenesis protein CcmE
MKAKYIVGCLIIVLFSLWGVSEFFNTTIRYVSLREAAAADRVVQVLGAIDFSTVDFNADSSRLEFQVYDSEAEDIQSASRLNVVYYGVVPGNFDQATSVVLKGKPTEGGAFVADQMLVKCPSKYQGDSEEDYQDIRKHEEGTSGSAG